MKFKISRYINIYEPIYPIMVMLVLIIIPYLIPTSENYRFKFIKFASVKEHLIFSVIVASCVLFTYYINFFLKNKKKNKIYSSRFLSTIYKVNKKVIQISFLMNIILVINGIVYLIMMKNLSSVKNVYSFYKGINIISQFYLIPLLINISLEIKNNKFKLKKYITLILIIFIRSILFSERLALIELVCSLVVILSMKGILKINTKKLIILVLVTVVFLVGNQTLRQYQMLKRLGNYSVANAFEESRDMLVTYYSDTMNKLYFQEKYNVKVVEEDSTFAYSVNRILSRLGIEVKAGEYSSYELLDFYNGRDIRMTNPGGLTQYNADFGNWLMVCLMFHVWVFVFVYNKAREDRWFFVGIYGYLYLSILELPRFNYLYLTRFTIPTIFYLCIYFVIVALSESK